MLTLKSFAKGIGKIVAATGMIAASAVYEVVTSESQNERKKRIQESLDKDIVCGRCGVTIPAGAFRDVYDNRLVCKNCASEYEAGGG